jgi:ribosomal protein RSM22 (predicted rRNA methylase)
MKKDPAAAPVEKGGEAQGADLSPADDGRQAGAGPDTLGAWSRIIRPLKKGKGHVIMDLCTPAGHLESLVVSRSSSGDTGGYKAARKATWGGLWPYTPSSSLVSV